MDKDLFVVADISIFLLEFVVRTHLFLKHVEMLYNLGFELVEIVLVRCFLIEKESLQFGQELVHFLERQWWELETRHFGLDGGEFALQVFAAFDLGCERLGEGRD